MRKRKTSAQVNLENFALLSLPENDPSLPTPRGAHVKKKPTSDLELNKLARTRAFGGLVPERSDFLDRLCRMLGGKAKPE